MFHPKLNASTLFFLVAVTIYLLMLLCVQKIGCQEVPLLPEPKEGYYWTVQATYVPHLDAVRYVPVQKEKWWPANKDLLTWLAPLVVSALSALGWWVKRKR